MAKSRPRSCKQSASPSTRLRREHAAQIVHEDAHGRVVTVPPAVREILELQRELFREKFGREPGPNDPIFFDPEEDEPRPIRADEIMDDVVTVAREVGLPAAKVYAIEKTGMIIVDGFNDHLFSDEDKAEWQAAIDEFNAMN